MKILLVNDDGYDQYGLAAVKEVLKQYGTVYVFAPLTVQSGKGCALTTFNPIKVHKQDEFNYLVEGTPVDCVQMAKTILGDENIDLVVSGCNYGFNLSNDILYSGTCGACIQAMIFKKKSIAFSGPKEFDFNKVKELTQIVFDYVFKNDLLSSKYWLNVNFQEDDFPDPKGIILTKQFIRETYYEVLDFDKNTDTYKVLRHHNYISDINYDVNCVKSGYISITPLSQSVFKEEIYNEVLNERPNIRKNI